MLAMADQFRLFPYEYIKRMDDEELFPTDFEAVLGVLTYVIREERDIELRVAKNMQEIQERFQKEVLPRYGITPPSTEQPAEPEASDATDLVQSEEKPPPCDDDKQAADPPPCGQPPPPCGAPQPPPQPEGESPDLEFPEDAAREITPLVKKLFKPVAVQCHPDKVKDTKLNKLFLIGRKAYNEGDVPTLLFVLTKFPSAVELDDSEMAEVKGYIDKKQAALIQKKDTFAYKWGFIREEDKQKILEQVQFGAPAPT
jgi:hypothetical protein